MAGPGIFVHIRTITFQIFIPKNIYTSCHNHKGMPSTTEKRTMKFIRNSSLVFLFVIGLGAIFFEKNYRHGTYFSLRRDLQINEAKLKEISSHYCFFFCLKF